MVTREQISEIRRSGISSLHDCWLESLFSGEPFIENGVISYFDGRVATLCGFPLRGQPAIEGAALYDVSRQWILERNAEEIVFIAPRRLTSQYLREHGFRCGYNAGGWETASEMLIDSRNASENVPQRSYYRRAIKYGLRSLVKTGDIISAEYLQLIERFYRRTELTPYLAQLAFVLPAILRSRRVYLIEVRKDDKLCGFTTVHKAFEDIAIGFFLAHDHRTSYVCDLLYGEALLLAERLGAKYLNVGASTSRGQHKFKRKWGGEPIVPPFFLAIWTRGHLGRRNYTSWGPRVIQL